MPRTAAVVVNAAIPSRYLGASRDARIRVRVSDGFNVTTRVSGRLHSVGTPPLVHILGPYRGGRVLSTTTLLLQGAAFDDSSRRLTGGRLKWYADRRLTLKATDSHRRTSSTMLRLRVAGPKPTLTFVRAQTKLSPRARHLQLTLASNVPALFTIAGSHHRIGPKRRAIEISVHPGRSPLHLYYSLRAAGGIVQGTYLVSR